MRLYLEGDQLLKIADEHREAYAAAQPFPHVVLDGLFPDEALDEVVAEFPPPTSQVWKEYENYHEKKLETQGESHLGDATCLLLYQFNSAPFLQFLERLTGIDHLLPDPYFYGGGLHQIERGGKLGIHADFSAHGLLPLQRRLNVLIYLNRDWKEEYGGALELWDADRTRCAQRILPVFNRTVIFTITDWAFHGHPDPMPCPEGRTRKSIALYYFSVDRPPGELMEGKGQTLFIQRPGEEVPAGTVFNRDTWSGLKGTEPPDPKPGQKASTRKTAKKVIREVTPPIVLSEARKLRQWVGERRDQLRPRS